MPYFQAKQIPDCGTAEQPIQPMETNNLKSTFLRFPNKIEALVVADATPSQTKLHEHQFAKLLGRRCRELQRDDITLQMRLQWNRKSMLLSPVAHNSTPWEKQLRHNRLVLRMKGNKGEHLLVTNDGDKSFWKRSAPVTFCGVSTMS